MRLRKRSCKNERIAERFVYTGKIGYYKDRAMVEAYKVANALNQGNAPIVDIRDIAKYSSRMNSSTAIGVAAALATAGTIVAIETYKKRKPKQENKVALQPAT